VFFRKEKEEEKERKKKEKYEQKKREKREKIHCKLGPTFHNSCTTCTRLPLVIDK
jgi:hypothetical protein